MFQPTKMPIPVTQNPTCRSRGSLCEIATAVDSSIVKCAAAALRTGPPPTIGDIRMP